MRLAVSLFALMLLCGGCAHYEYNIVQPQDLRGHIGADADHIVRLDALEYRFRSFDNKLVTRIYNTSPDAIQLAGDRSTVVAPSGQSHPLRSQTIAPQSFIKLIFPPPRPQVPAYGPTLGIGFGARVDRAPIRQRDHAADDPPPRYLTTYGVDEAYYWDWNDQSDITVTFVYLRGSNSFSQRFTFHKQKM